MSVSTTGASSSALGYSPPVAKSISADGYTELSSGNLETYNTAQHLRSSQISPEDLQAYAERQSNSQGPGDHPAKIKVVTAQQFVEESKKELGRRGTGLSRAMTPVVFAMPSCTDTGRKVVDFYYSWKGKKGTKPLKGTRRKSQFLSGEFENKVWTALHEDHREIERMNSLGRPRHENYTPRPHGDNVPLPPDHVRDEVPPRPPVRPTSAGTASTLSLPFAAMAQFNQDGVTVANPEQMHLRAVNPDSLSPTSTESARHHRKTKKHRRSPLGKEDITPPARTPSVSSSETLIEKESAGHHRSHRHSSKHAENNDGESKSSSHHRHRSHHKDKDGSPNRRHKSSSRHRSPKSPRRAHSDPEFNKDDRAKDETLTVVLMDGEEDDDPRPWHNIAIGRLPKDSPPTPPELTRNSPWTGTAPLPNLPHNHSEPVYRRPYDSDFAYDEWESESDSDSEEGGYTPFPPQLARQMWRYSLEDYAPVMPFSPGLQRTLERNTPQSYHTPLPHSSPVMLPQHSSGFSTPQTYPVHMQSPHPSIQSAAAPSHYSPFPSLQYLPLPNQPMTSYQSPYVVPNTLYNGEMYSHPQTPVYPSHIYANYPPSPYVPL